MERVYTELLKLANLELERTGVRLKIQKFWGKMKICVNAPSGDNIDNILEQMTGISDLIYKLKMQGNKTRNRDKPDYWFQCELENFLYE